MSKISVPVSHSSSSHSPPPIETSQSLSIHSLHLFQTHLGFPHLICGRWLILEVSDFSTWKIVPVG